MRPLLLALLFLSGCARWANCMAPQMAPIVNAAKPQVREALADPKPIDALDRLSDLLGPAVACAVIAIVGEVASLPGERWLELRRYRCTP